MQMNNPFKIEGNRPPVSETELIAYSVTGMLFGAGVGLITGALIMEVYPIIKKAKKSKKK